MLKPVFKFSLCLVLTLGKCYSQDKVIKHLYFFEDKPEFVACGTMIHVGLFYFVSDTSVNEAKDSAFMLAMICPEGRGADSFKKYNLYEVALSKDFKDVRKYMNRAQFDLLQKEKNFYTVEAIKLEKACITTLSAATGNSAKL